MRIDYIIFAQADPGAQFLKDWVGVLLYIVGAIGAILGVLVLIKQLREKPSKPTKFPNPVIIREAEDFVTLIQHKEAVDDIKRELLRHGARRAEIYKQNEEHGKAIAALQAETKAQTLTMHHLANQMDGLPVKIKTLLFPHRHD